jgi:hypothetical protein
MLLMEVGDDEQAMRVAKLATERLGGGLNEGREGKVEIWRDSPDSVPQPHEDRKVEINGQLVYLKGSGTLRTVVLLS